MHLRRSYWEWESQGDSGEAKYEQTNELLRWWGWANYENLTVIWTDFNWIDWMERKYYGWIILFAINVRHMSAFCVVIVVTLVTTSTNPMCAPIDAVCLTEIGFFFLFSMSALFSCTLQVFVIVEKFMHQFGEMENLEQNNGRGCFNNKKEIAYGSFAKGNRNQLMLTF